jgi:hypothetical protein
MSLEAEGKLVRSFQQIAKSDSSQRGVLAAVSIQTLKYVTERYVFLYIKSGEIS